MERLVAWDLSGQAGQKARGMVIVKFVNWATNQLDSRTFNSDLDSDEAAKIIKSIKKNLRKLNNLAGEKLSEGVAPSYWRPKLNEIKDDMKRLFHKEEWSGTVNATEPWGETETVYSEEEESSGSFDEYSGTITHWYLKGEPNSFEIELTLLTQGDRYAFQGQLEAGKIDMITTVPFIDPLLTDAQFASRTSSGSHPPNQWQRSIRPDRVKQIGKFLDKKKSYLFNEILLHADTDNDSIDFQYSEKLGTATLTVKFDFLKNHADSFWTDKWEGNDLRPLWIIDGQHRVRGAAISKRGHKLRLPILVTLSGKQAGKLALPKKEIAKLFAEINTQAKPISDEHRYYSGNRFKIPSLKKWNFGGDSSGLPNRTAYKLACDLCSEEGGPLFNSIRLTPKRTEREKKNIVTDIGTWMGKVSGWLPRFHDNNPDRMFLEVTAYYTAMMNTMNKANPDINGWNPEFNREKKTNKNLLRQKGPFSVTYDMYEHVRDISFHLSKKDKKSENKKDWLSISDFEQAMEPWKNVPFRNSKITKVLTGKQRNIPYLRTWLLQCLWAVHLGGHNSPSSVDVLDNEKRGILCGGILTVPEITELVIDEGKFELPSLFKDDCIIDFKRPWNTYALPDVEFTAILSNGEAIIVPCGVPVEDRTTGAGWIIADYENNELLEKQTIQIHIEAANVPENAVKLHLKVHFVDSFRRQESAEPSSLVYPEPEGN